MTGPGATQSPADDRAAVTRLLGRTPQGAFEVVVRDHVGEPVVIRNAPLLDDGTPMPTRYWLVGEDVRRVVGTLEADGGVRQAELEIPAEEIAAAHHRYAVERDAAIPADALGPRPSGGVGGTRQGVKCLHAHYAWHLAGGDDPVGRWVARRLAEQPLTVTVDDHRMTWTDGSQRIDLPVGLRDIGSALESDPPRPEELTNAIGAIVDHLDDLLREHPHLAGRPVVWRGAVADMVADVEVGVFGCTPQRVERDAAEELFRTMATESAAERARNPGLRSEHVDDALRGSCLLVAMLRGLHLDGITVGG